MEIKKVMILLFLSVFLFGSFDGVMGVSCTSGSAIFNDGENDFKCVGGSVQIKPKGSRVYEDYEKSDYYREANKLVEVAPNSAVPLNSYDYSSADSLKKSIISEYKGKDSILAVEIENGEDSVRILKSSQYSGFNVWTDRKGINNNIQEIYSNSGVLVSYYDRMTEDKIELKGTQYVHTNHGDEQGRYSASESLENILNNNRVSTSSNEKSSVEPSPSVDKEEKGTSISNSRQSVKICTGKTEICNSGKSCCENIGGELIPVNVDDSGKPIQGIDPNDIKKKITALESAMSRVDKDADISSLSINMQIAYGIVFNKDITSEILDQCDLDTLIFIRNSRTEFKKNTYINGLISEKFGEKNVEEQVELIKNGIFKEDTLQTFLLGNLNNENFDKLCSIKPETCQKALFSASMGDSNNRDDARKKLESMIADGTITLTSEEIGVIILNTNDEKQKEDWAKAYNGIDCSGFFASFVCSVKGQDTQRQLQEKAVKDIVQKTSEAERYIYYGTKGPEDTFCDAGESVSKCRTKFKECEKNKGSVDCKNMENFERDINLYGSYDYTVVKDDSEQTKNNLEDELKRINQKMKEDIIDKLDLPKANNDLAAKCLEIDDDCMKAIGDACAKSGVYDTAKNCISSTTDALKQADREVPVTTNSIFTLFDSLKNPDEMALKAAEAFGTEIDFSKIGSKTISQSIPSRICYNKIKGYLDKEVETNGGVTKYACDDYNESTNPSDLCADVQADLRAQRTSITPDNKTLVSYSYYVKDTEGSFQLYIIYDQNEIEQNYTITNETKGSDYDSILLPLNQTQGIDEESFKIVMKRDDFTLQANIILITPENLYTN